MQKVGIVRRPSNRGQWLVLVRGRMSRQAKAGDREGWRRVHVDPNDVREVEQNAVGDEQRETKAVRARVRHALWRRPLSAFFHV